MISAIYEVAVLVSISYISLQIGLQKLTNEKRIMENQNRNEIKFGFTSSAENWNGRLAMIGFSAALIIELVSGKGVLHFWGLM